MKIKDISKGGIYAVRRAVFVDHDGRRLDRGEVAARLDELWNLDRVVESGIVEARHRNDGTWTVRFGDGTTERVHQHDFLGRWDNHLATLDINAAANRLSSLAVEFGWAAPDPDGSLGSLAASTLFGGPVGIVDGGKVELRLTAEQAHQLADALRDTQVKAVAR